LSNLVWTWYIQKVNFDGLHFSLSLRGRSD